MIMNQILQLNVKPLSNNIKQKMAENNINKTPSKIIRKKIRSLGKNTQLLTHNIFVKMYII